MGGERKRPEASLSLPYLTAQSLHWPMAGGLTTSRRARNARAARDHQQGPPQRSRAACAASQRRTKRSARLGRAGRRECGSNRVEDITSGQPVELREQALTSGSVSSREIMRAHAAWRRPCGGPAARPSGPDTFWAQADAGSRGAADSSPRCCCCCSPRTRRRRWLSCTRSSGCPWGHGWSW